MIEKDKTYTYEELKEILPKASAEVVVKLTNEMESAGCDAGFISMMSLNNTLTLAELAKRLFHKVEEEKEEK